MPKGDKLGLATEMEKIILNILEITITSALSPKSNKIPLLQTNRIKIEVLKKMVRLIYDLKIINTAKYFDLQFQLQNISKENTNWLNSLIPKELK